MGRCYRQLGLEERRSTACMQAVDLKTILHQIAERHAAWAKRLPEEPEALWAFLHGLSDAERLELLAHCVSLTASAVRAPRQCGGEPEAHAAVLAHDVALDMTAYCA